MHAVGPDAAAAAHMQGALLLGLEAAPGATFGVEYGLCCLELLNDFGQEGVRFCQRKAGNPRYGAGLFGQAPAFALGGLGLSPLPVRSLTRSQPWVGDGLPLNPMPVPEHQLMQSGHHHPQEPDGSQQR